MHVPTHQSAQLDFLIQIILIKVKEVDISRCCTGLFKTLVYEYISCKLYNNFPLCLYSRYEMLSVLFRSDRFANYMEIGREQQVGTRVYTYIGHIIFTHIITRIYTIAVQYNSGIVSMSYITIIYTYMHYLYIESRFRVNINDSH